MTYAEYVALETVSVERPGERAALPSLDAELLVDEIYRSSAIV
jgi:hypothetical protein